MEPRAVYNMYFKTQKTAMNKVRNKITNSTWRSLGNELPVGEFHMDDETEDEETEDEEMD